jgi:hypothetical protein
MQGSRYFEPAGAYFQTAKALKGLAGAARKKSTRAMIRAGGFDELFKKQAVEFMGFGVGLPPKEAANLAKKTFGKSPAAVLMEDIGVYGPVEFMADDLETFARFSKETVDIGLQRIKTRFVSGNIKRPLERLKDALGDVEAGLDSPSLVKTRNYIQQLIDKHDGKIKRTFVEVLQERESKFMDEFGRPITVREPVRVPKETRGPAQGISLSEANEIKRLMDDLINPYKNSGEISGIGTVDFGKAGINEVRIKAIREDLQGFIERQAGKKGFTDLAKENKKTMFATQMANHFRDMEFSFKGRKPFMSEFLGSFFAGGGTVGFAVTGNPAYILGALGLVKARRMLKDPKFVTTLANRLYTLADPKYKAFTDTVRGLRDTGKLTGEGVSIGRQIGRELRKAFPEIRAAGIAEREYETIEE